MANTYTQLYYHVVCVVKGRQSLIVPALKDELYKYVTGIIEHQGQKLYIINGMPDHIHLLISCGPTIVLSNLVKEIKEHSTKYINGKNIIKGKFSWQVGFGAFTVSKRNVEQVYNYIKNQETHHKKKKFKEEYVQFLKEQEVDYHEKYLFEEVD